jgi:hypothetical protein
VDSGGNRAILHVGGKRVTRPARRGGRRAVGVKQQRGIDVQNAGKFKKRARHNTRSALCTEYVSCDPLYTVISALITVPRVAVIMNCALLYLSVS